MGNREEGEVEELWQGQAGFRVTEDRGEGEEGRPGANVLTPNSHVDQRYSSTPKMHAR